MYDLLLSPMQIGSMTVKNRTVMTAAEFSLGQTNGKPTERLMEYYEERARGGVGMIIPGICRVNDMGGASTFTQLSMSHDYHIAPMHEFAERIHRHGAKLCIQLHHPGRQGYSSSTNSLPLVIPIRRRTGAENLLQCPAPALPCFAEGYLRVPVFDRTGVFHHTDQCIFCLEVSDLGILYLAQNRSEIR